MKQNLIAIGCGILFGLGLAISQMIDSARVLGFLDVAGTWDPTLMFVLGGAVGVTVVSFRFVLRRANPFFAPKFYLPGKDSIDRRLLVGASIFGVGWGISGYCPGPGFSSLALFNSWNPLIFLISLAVGSWSYRWLSHRTKASQSRASQIKQSSAVVLQ